MKHKIGTRVYIVNDLRNNGNTTGQEATYNGVVESIPVLVLDNGDILYGNQCLWKSLDTKTKIKKISKKKNKKPRRYNQGRFKPGYGVLS